MEEEEFGKDLRLHFDDLCRKYSHTDETIKKEFQDIAKYLDKGLTETIIHHGRIVLIYKRKIVASIPGKSKNDVRMLEELSTVYTNSFMIYIPYLRKI